ncbi:MAG: hypothetical protein RL071_1385 [Pseudomonadota bacterium]|jgi:hypothetical protein
MSAAPPEPPDDDLAQAPRAGSAPSRDERRKARARRGMRARPKGRGTPPPVEPMEPPPLVEAPPPQTGATGDEVADLLLERLTDDEAPPAQPVTGGLWGRPHWHWGLLGLISVAVGAVVAVQTGDGPLVLSSAAATALALGSFMALYTPPAAGLPPGRAPAAPAAPRTAPSLAATAPEAGPRLNRAARRHAAAPNVEAPPAAPAADGEAAAAPTAPAGPPAPRRAPRIAHPRSPKDLR